MSKKVWRDGFPWILAIACYLIIGPVSCASNPRLEVLEPAFAPPGGSILPDAPWEMHLIDNPNYRLPNGLDAADADGDGRTDFVTNYEWDGFIRIAFGPRDASIPEAWPAFTIGRVPNAESSCFGDVDGDGDPDVIVAHGAETLGSPGVSVLINPGGASARSGKAWSEVLEIPAAGGLGHFHFVRCRDLDGDGRQEIVVGGRGKNPRAGLRILEPQRESGQAIDFSTWSIAEVDSRLESGFGFEFGDLDGDGDEDIALANSDWDTEPGEQMVVWYENPRILLPIEARTLVVSKTFLHGAFP